MATQEQQQVRDWMSAFGQETPEKPTIPTQRTCELRTKLTLTEALEKVVKGFKIHAVSFFDSNNHEVTINLETLRVGLEHGEPRFHFHGTPDLEQILDGCEDLKVVTEGTLVACGLITPVRITKKPAADWGYDDVYRYEDPHFSEVMRSNWTKLWTMAEIIQRVGTTGLNLPHGLLKTTVDWDGAEGMRYATKVSTNNRCWLVKDSSGKIIKSPSYSAPKFNL